MGLRVRKSVKIGKYLKVNFNKSGISLSGGVKGARVTVNKNGVRQTVGIPGTGISYSNYDSFKSKKNNKKVIAAPVVKSAPKRIKVNTLPDGVIMPYVKKRYRYCAYLSLLFLFLGPLGIAFTIIALAALFFIPAFDKQHMANVAFKKGIDHYLYGELDQAKAMCNKSLNLVDNQMVRILIDDINNKMNAKISL